MKWSRTYEVKSINFYWDIVTRKCQIKHKQKIFRGKNIVTWLYKYAPSKNKFFVKAPLACKYSTQSFGSKSLLT